MPNFPHLLSGRTIGLVAFALVIATAGSHAARAQSSFQTVTTIAPPPKPTAVPPRRSGLPPVAEDTEPSYGEPRILNTLRPRLDQDEETATSGASGDDPEAGEPGAEPSAADLRDTTEDAARPSPLLRDGFGGQVTVPGGDPLGSDVSQSGADDARLDEDRAAFEAPPAGHDPILFDTEVAPLLSERPAQLFRFEPYTPIGIRYGGFVLLPQVETGLLYDGNVAGQAGGRSDKAIEIIPAVRIVSDWKVHAVELRASGAISRFAASDDDNVRKYALAARGRLDITRRTTIEGLVSRDLGQESRNAIDATSTSERADVVTDQAAIALNHRFNRLGLQLRGSVENTDYSNVAGISNSDRDSVRREVALRASWEFKPTLFAFAEVAANRETYGAVSANDGLSRDSTGERYRVGLSFGSTSQILRGEFGVGYGVQRPDDGSLQSVSGLILDSNLAWRVSGLTTLLFSARTDFDGATSSGVSGVLTRATGVDVRHELRRDVIATAGLGYKVDDYEGSSLRESEILAIMGLEYFLNQETTLFSRYQHTTFSSNAAGRDYRDNEFRVGMRWAR